MPNPAFVQANNATQSTTQSSISATYSNAQTSGNCNVVCVWFQINNSLSQFEQITDSKGNQYRLASFSYTSAWGSQMAVFVSFGITAAGAGANTVTVTIKGSAANSAIIVSEYSGAIDCSTGAANAGTGTSATAGNVLTFNANETLVAFVDNTVTATFTTTGTGGTANQRQQAGAFGLFGFDLACGAVGTYGITWNNFSGTNATVTWEACLISLSSVSIAAQANFLVPPMGWDSWRVYGLSATETTVHNQANAVVSNGLPALGYTLFSVSDVLYNGRTSGNLVTNTTAFPSGDTALFNFITSKGLKNMQYLGPGATGCNSFPGSDTFETTDANKFAAAGIKFLMYDNCTDFLNSDATRAKYATMVNAVKASSAPFPVMVSTPVFENCYIAGSQLWGKSIGADMFLTMTDQGTPLTWAKLIALADTQVYLTPWTKPGFILFPDWLGTANGTLTVAEGRSNFALYCMLPSALFLGCDMTSIGAADLATIKNTELISINQDALVSGAMRVSRIPTGADTVEVWARKVTGFDWAVMLWNRDSVSNPVTVNWSMFGQTGANFAIRDMINHVVVGSSTVGYTTNVASHDVAMLLLYDPFSPYAPIDFQVSTSLIAQWRDVEPSNASLFFESASDPYFTQNFVSTPIAQILPPGFRTLTVPVPNLWYRVRVSRPVGTAYSNTWPIFPPLMQQWNAHGIKPSNSKNIQHLQTVNAVTVNSGTVSSAVATLTNIVSKDIICVRISWKSGNGSVSSVSGSLNGSYLPVPGALQSYYGQTTAWYYLSSSSAGNDTITATLSGSLPGVVIEATELSPWEVYTATPAGPNNSPFVNPFNPGGPRWNNLNVIQDYISNFNSQNIYLTLPHP